MFRLQFFLILSLALMATSCSKKKASSPPRVAPPVETPQESPVAAPPENASSDPFGNNQTNSTPPQEKGRYTFSYSFYDEENSCSTDKHIFNGNCRRCVLQSYCQELLNEELNHNCAYQKRKMLYRLKCQAAPYCGNPCLSSYRRLKKNHKKCRRSSYFNSQSSEESGDHKESDVSVERLEVSGGERSDVGFEQERQEQEESEAQEQDQNSEIPN